MLRGAITKTATIAFCGLLLSSGCAADKSTPQSRDSVNEPESKPEKPLFSVRKRTLSQFKQELHEKYLCRPSAVFLRSFAAVHDFCSAQASKEESVAALQWQDKKWRVTVDGVVVGTLSELPTFSEFYSLLQKYARQELSSSALPRTVYEPVQNLDVRPAALIQTIAQSGSHFRAEPTKEKFALVAEATAWLCIQQLDLLEVCDQLPARALALQALLDAAGNTTNSPTGNTAASPAGNTAASPTGNTAASPSGTLLLLADSLGYSSFAESKANLTTEPDIRAFLKRDKVALQSLASKSKAPFRTQFLFANLLAKMQLQDEWRKFAAERLAQDKAGSLGTLKTFYPLAGDDSLLPLGASLMSAVNTQMRYGEARHNINVKRLTWSFETLSDSADYLLGDLLSEFEDNTKFLSANQDNPFFSNELLVQYYRGYFYSAVKLIADAYLALPSARPICERLADNLHVKKLKQSQELEEWLRMRVSSHSASDRELATHLTKLQQLGAPALMDLSRAFARSGTSFESYTRDTQISQMLLSRCDSRLPHMNFLTQVSINRLRDASLAKNFGRFKWTESGVEERTNLGILKFGYSKSKTASILASLGNRPASIFEQLEFIKELSVSSLNTNEQVAALSHIAARNRNSWLAASALCRALIDAHREAEAFTFIQKWLSSNPKITSQDKIEAHSLAAFALYKLGKFSDAEKELGHASDLFPWIKTRALLSLAIGQNKEALAYAQGALDRYPSNIEALGLYLHICWSSGRYDEAAAKLNDNRTRLGATEYDTTIGSAFAHAFARNDSEAIHAAKAFARNDSEAIHAAKAFARNDSEAMQAAKALARVQLNNTECLGRLSAAAYRSGNTQLAFSLLSQIAAAPNQDPVRFLHGYFYLSKLKGNAAALDWLQKQVPLNVRNDLAAPAFQLGMNELLWGFIPDKPSGANVERVWLIRAAATCGSNNLSPDRQKLLRDHASSQPEPYGSVARMLLDQSSSSALEAVPMTDLELCRAGFFLAWRAARQTSELVNATSGFSCSAQTLQAEAPEFVWSLTWLTNIYTQADELLAIDPATKVTITIRDWTKSGVRDSSNKNLHTGYDVHYEIIRR